MVDTGKTVRAGARCAVPAGAGSGLEEGRGGGATGIGLSMLTGTIALREESEVAIGAATEFGNRLGAVEAREVLTGLGAGKGLGGGTERVLLLRGDAQRGDLHLKEKKKVQCTPR
jgi:hypothetical protein